MASFNRVILVGNLTKDPQVRYTPGGTAVTDVGLAINRVWFDKQSNTKKEDVTFVEVTLWGRQAEVAGEYLSKGRSVLIEGRLQLDQWEDRETGQKRSKLKVVGEQMTMLGSGSDGQHSGGGGGGGGGGYPEESQNAPRASETEAPQDPHYDNPANDVPEDEVPF